MKVKKQVFISYSSKDSVLAKRIANDLQKAGVTVWIDTENIRVGSQIPKKIQQGLDNSEYVAVLFTKNTSNSPWVEKEWNTKLEDDISNDKDFIFPLKFDDSPIPTLLKDKKYADFRTDYNSGIKYLIDAFIPSKHAPSNSIKKVTEHPPYIQPCNLDTPTEPYNCVYFDSNHLEMIPIVEGLLHRFSENLIEEFLKIIKNAEYLILQCSNITNSLHFVNDFFDSKDEQDIANNYLSRKLQPLFDGQPTTTKQIVAEWKQRRTSILPIIIVGNSGTGKTTELFNIAFHLKQEHYPNKLNTLCCSIREKPKTALIDEKKNENEIKPYEYIETCVKLSLGLHDIEPQIFRQLLLAVQPLIFLLELNDLADSLSEKKYIISGVEEFSNVHRHHLLFIAYRRLDSDDILRDVHLQNSNRGMQAYMFAPFSEEIIMRCRSSLTDITKDDSTKLENSLLKEISTNALMLYLWKIIPDQTGITNKGQLYYRYCALWAAQMYRLKVNPSILMIIATHICLQKEKLEIKIDPKSTKQNINKNDLDLLVSSHILINNGQNKYGFIHDNFCFFFAAYALRYSHWTKPRDKKNWHRKIGKIITKGLLYPHFSLVFLYYPGILKEMDNSGNELKSFEKWIQNYYQQQQPKALTKLKERNTRQSIVQLAYCLSDQIEGFSKIILEALGDADNEVRLRAMEQLVIIFDRPEDINRNFGIPAVLDQLKQKVIIEIQESKSIKKDYVLPWLLTKLGSLVTTKILMCIGIVSSNKPFDLPMRPRPARFDSLMHLLLVLSGFHLSKPKAKRNRELTEYIRQLAFCVLRDIMFSSTVKQLSDGTQHKSYQVLKFVTLIIQWHYRQNRYPCNYFEIKHALLGKNSGNENCIIASPSTIKEIADLFVLDSNQFIERIELIRKYCKIENGLTSWYMYTILSIYGNNPETSHRVIDLLGRLARSQHPNSVSSYIAFHSFRCLLTYSDTIQSDNELFEKASLIFKELATNILSSGQNNSRLVFIGSKVNKQFKESFKRNELRIYDNKVLLYYSQYLCATDNYDELNRIITDRLNNDEKPETPLRYYFLIFMRKMGLSRIRHIPNIDDFRYTCSVLASLGTKYPTEATKLLIVAQKHIGSERNKRYIERANDKAICDAFDRISEFYPDQVAKARIKSKPTIYKTPIRRAPISPEIYSPISHFGDAVYQNALYNNKTQELFGKGTKLAADARSQISIKMMFDFFYAYSKTIATGIDNIKYDNKQE